MMALLIAAAVFYLSTLATAKQRCPDGWIVFDQSCYRLFDDRDMRWDDAMSYCVSNESLLFVPDSFKEWETLRLFVDPGTFMWIGLTSDQSLPSGHQPMWASLTGMDYHELPWLIKSSSTYGHSAAQDCVSLFSSPITRLSYTNWFSCTIPRSFMCERNATVSNAMSRLSRFMRGR